MEHSKANISDTQVATFEYDDLKIVWQHRTWGDPPDPKYQWGATLYGDKGTLKASVYSYDFTPTDKHASPIHQDVTYELEQYPEDKTEKNLETHCAPAIRHHMEDFPGSRSPRAQRIRWRISKRAIFRRPVASWPICRCVPDGRWRGTRRMGV